MQRHTAVDVEVLAQEVSRRLCAVNEAAVVNDPHSHVLRIAAEVETEWEGRARRSRIDRGTDALPAPSASASTAVRAAVLALRRQQRQLLLLHLEGLTYRQIAAKAGKTEAEVLRELVSAYVHLRRTMVDVDGGRGRPGRPLELPPPVSGSKSPT